MLAHISSHLREFRVPLYEFLHVLDAFNLARTLAGLLVVVYVGLYIYSKLSEVLVDIFFIKFVLFY